MENQKYNLNPSDYLIIHLTEEASREDDEFKILVLGDERVGKTSILNKALKQTFSDEYTSTTGFEFFDYLVQVNRKVFDLKFWDTSSKQNFHQQLLTQCKSMHFGIVVYAINNRDSFEKAKELINEIKKECNENRCSFCLIGNKSDMAESRQVSIKEGEEYANEGEFLFFEEVSAKEGFKSPSFIERISVFLYVIYIYINIII